MLHIQGLRKSYGEVVALNGVDLDVAGGEITSLLGPNGAGKTTIVSIVAGLRRADAGVVEVGGWTRSRAAARFVVTSDWRPRIWASIRSCQSARTSSSSAGSQG
jgi:ABC-type multidrug transport system ATPase subunit